MKLHVLELSNIGKKTQQSTLKKVLLLPISLFFLTVAPFSLLKSSSSSSSPLPLRSTKYSVTHSTSASTEMDKKCDMFSGDWVQYPSSYGSYYTNASCHEIINQQNCLKFGRPDTEFLKWRWKPDDCELPRFDAAGFFELVRGKSMAFVGDSVGRNQMQSLLCLLSAVVYPVDISHKYTTDTNFKHWLYTDYNFVLATFWSPFLVKAGDADVKGHSLNSLMSLHLDEADEAWATQIEKFDYVIISAGQWFFRPLMFYENRKLVGCHNCHKKNITSLSKYYGYRMAFRTAFETLITLKNYKGVTILRTFSPAHFENGEWNKGGRCERTRPFKKQDIQLDGYILEMYLTQLEELRGAQMVGMKKGLEFKLLDITEAMLLRGDGHPNHYGHRPHENVTVADCVHWCLPGPIDTWNEFLLQMLRMEDNRKMLL